MKIIQSITIDTILLEKGGGGGGSTPIGKNYVVVDI